MPRLLVVADSNFYRGQSFPAVDYLTRLGRSHGIVAIASQWVIVELLSHLTEATDPDFTRCWKALSKMLIHTAIRDEITVYASPRSSIELNVFGADGTVSRDVGILMSRTATIMAKARTEAEVLAGAPEARIARDFTARKEHAFVERFRKIEEWRDSVDPKARDELIATVNNDGLRLSAEYVLKELEVSTQRKVPGANREEMIGDLLAAIPVAIRFDHQLMKDVLFNGLNMGNVANVNCVWDREIAQFASPYFKSLDSALLNESPVMLISNDKRIHSAARSCGQQNRVWRSEDYAEVLSSGNIEVFPVQ